MIEFNLADLPAAGQPATEGFFRLSPTDPSQGFTFFWNHLPANTYPPNHSLDPFPFPRTECNTAQLRHQERLTHKRLFLACHLADFLRQSVFNAYHHTASAGISTTKLTAKLIGSINKPDKQTVLIPSFTQSFLDTHEIGKIPGIGFKIAQKLRDEVLEVVSDKERVYVYEDVVSKVTVEDARLKLDAEKISKILGSRQAGQKVYGWLCGIDPSPVTPAALIPTQISIEDTFRALNDLSQLIKVLQQLATKLVQRMRIDLLSKDPVDITDSKQQDNKEERLNWMAYPRTFRLSIRQRDAKQFSRASKSSGMPRYVFDLTLQAEAIGEKLVKEVAMPLFKRLNPSTKVDLQLVNVAAVNMEDDIGGDDIGRMLSRNNDVAVARRYKVEKDSFDLDEEIRAIEKVYQMQWESSEAKADKEQGLELASVYDEEGFETDETGENECDGDVPCPECGVALPLFAVEAHARFHGFENNIQ